MRRIVVDASILSAISHNYIIITPYNTALTKSSSGPFTARSVRTATLNENQLKRTHDRLKTILRPPRDRLDRFATGSDDDNVLS
jgi:hypothetical protein